MRDAFVAPCQHLVEAIEQAIGHPLSPLVRRAFLTIERRAFVPRYYIKEGYQWHERFAGEEVYENRFFFTRLDERGVPNSSSSQPSLMAHMLEMLDLAPGQRVLEIGTGTGYNAALLGTIVGPTGQVLSIDIAPDLVAQAATRLRDMPWVQTVQADGLRGYDAFAPYDRIIATGGASQIPRTWIAQLAPGGLLVGSLHLSLSTATPLYRVVKQDDGSARGSLQAISAYFMSLYTQESLPSSLLSTNRYETMPVIEQAETSLDFPRLLRDLAFAFFVEMHLPGLQSLLRPSGKGPHNGTVSFDTWLLLPEHAMLVIHPKEAISSASTPRWDVEARGDEPLWSRLLDIFKQWEHLSKPSLDRYQIAVDHDASSAIHLDHTNGGNAFTLTS